MRQSLQQPSACTSSIRFSKFSSFFSATAETKHRPASRCDGFPGKPTRWCAAPGLARKSSARYARSFDSNARRRRDLRLCHAAWQIAMVLRGRMPQAVCRTCRQVQYRPAPRLVRTGTIRCSEQRSSWASSTRGVASPALLVILSCLSRGRIPG